MSLALVSELFDAHITTKGEVRLGNPDAKTVNSVLRLSHAGKPFKKTLQLYQNGSKLTFLVKIPDLKILDPCGITNSLLGSHTPQIKDFQKVLNHFSGSDGVDFMARFFKQVYKWNETSCEKLADSIWVTNKYSWHYGDGSKATIGIRVEPVVSRDKVNCVKFVSIQISGFQRIRVTPLNNGKSVVDELGPENVEEKLTKREMEVLDLIVKGYTSKVIANKLYISEHTVKNHRKNMMRKVDVSNVIQLLNKTSVLV